MITDSKEFEKYLAEVATTAPSILKMRIPTDEEIYTIDWDSRKITVPKFIGVEGDHQAEYVFYEMDRYHDLMDLADTIGFIVFKNSRNEEFYQLIPYYDIYSIEGKIIFPWTIQAPVALSSGTVSFSFKFIKVDPNDGKLIYEINTQPGKTKILTGWSNISDETHTYKTLNPESIIIDNETLENLNVLLRAENKIQIYWKEV